MLGVACCFRRHLFLTDVSTGIVLGDVRGIFSVGYSLRFGRTCMGFNIGSLWAPLWRFKRERTGQRVGHERSPEDDPLISSCSAISPHISLQLSTLLFLLGSGK